MRNLSAEFTTLERLSTDHLDELRAQRGPDSHTLRARSTDLRLFLAWALQRGVTRRENVTRAAPRGWVAHLHPDGYARSSAARMFSSVRSLLGCGVRPSMAIDANALQVTSETLPRDLLPPTY